MKTFRSNRALLSRAGIAQFMRYNVGGIAFFAVGYGVFVLLYGVFSWKWWAAKIVADLLGWITNYLVQRFWAFRHESRDHKEHKLLVRFSTVSLMNVPLDYALVGLLKFIGVTPFIGLWLSSLFFTFWKFVLYKHYVFRKPHTIA